MIMLKGESPLQIWPLSLCALCVFAGAGLSVSPFLLEYRAAARRAENQQLSTAVEQIQNLEQLAAQINSATTQWQCVQDQASQSVKTAEDLTDRLAQEAKAVGEMVQKANVTERNRLQLEVEKFRRGEAEWLQVVTRLLDHTYALHQAAVRSGQRDLIEQLTMFQNACRDVVRRVGLVPFAALPDEAYDVHIHQLANDQEEVPAGTVIAQTIATGFTYQGQLLRRAVVVLASQGPPSTSAQPETALFAEPLPAEAFNPSVPHASPTTMDPPQVPRPESTDDTLASAEPAPAREPSETTPAGEFHPVEAVNPSAFPSSPETLDLPPLPTPENPVETPPPAEPAPAPGPVPAHPPAASSKEDQEYLLLELEKAATEANPPRS